ncbi:MAG: hypothetical protein ACRC1K_23545, partial [Planctomycetia bacterium]
LVRDLAPDVPTELCDVVGWILADAPVDHYATAAGVEAALQTFASPTPLRLEPSMIARLRSGECPAASAAVDTVEDSGLGTIGDFPPSRKRGNVVVQGGDALGEAPPPVSTGWWRAVVRWLSPAS